MNNSELTQNIKNITIDINTIDDNFIRAFKWLSEEIYNGKAPLKTNTVQFIIVKILNKNKQTNDIKKRDFFTVYVIGDFRKTFTPALKVAEAFASFYIEMGVLPNIVPIPKSYLIKHKELLYKLKNGVVIYERR